MRVLVTSQCREPQRASDTLGFEVGLKSFYAITRLGIERHAAEVKSVSQAETIRSYLCTLYTCVSGNA